MRVNGLPLWEKGERVFETRCQRCKALAMYEADQK